MKKRDIIIIVAVLAVAFAAFIAVNLFQSRESGVEDFVYIYVNDTLYEADPLSEDKLIEIDQGNGMVNHVQIKDGKVYTLGDTIDRWVCDQPFTLTDNAQPAAGGRMALFSQYEAPNLKIAINFN